MVGFVVGAAGIVAVVGLFAVSAFFSSSEIAIFSLPDSWIDEQSATGDGRAAILQELSEAPTGCSLPCWSATTWSTSRSPAS
jgi:CBS domain containing-hemolysin-like protein